MPAWLLDISRCRLRHARCPRPARTRAGWSRCIRGHPLIQTWQGALKGEVRITGDPKSTGLEWEASK